MAKELVTDALWEVLTPLLPEEHPSPRAAEASYRRPRTLTGILFLLKSGIPWEMLPQEMGCRSGMTCCWRRLKEWYEAGMCERLHQALLDRLGGAGKIDWGRASLGSASMAAFEAEKPNPQHPRHLLTDSRSNNPNKRGRDSGTT